MDTDMMDAGGYDIDLNVGAPTEAIQPEAPQQVIEVNAARG